MKKIFYLVLLAGLICNGCQQQSNNTNEETAADSLETETTASTGITLEKIWETDTLLTTCESVVYDVANDVFYVSCIGSDEPWASDNTGFIAKVGSDGNIIEAKWVTGLHAPKGLGLVGNTLYANDNDQLAAIDITTGKIIKKMPVGEGKSLNDIAVGVNDELYISDSNTNTIYKVENDEVSTFYQDSLLGGLNGIWAEADRLMVVGFSGGLMSTLSLDGKELQKVSEGMQGADGVVHNDIGYFVSAWNGRLWHIDDEDWTQTKLLDTEGEKINAADIEIVADKNLILVPTFFDNRVMAYRVVE